MKTRHDACAFFDREELIDGEIRKSLPLAAGPTNRYLGAFRLAQSKMQPEIVARQKARLTLYFLRLSRARSFDTTRPPIALRFDLVPISFTFNHELLPATSFLSSDGGSFRLITRMSRSPSLSKSPKAQPRLLCGS